jgi:hypothetical protein
MPHVVPNGISSFSPTVDPRSIIQAAHHEFRLPTALTFFPGNEWGSWFYIHVDVMEEKCVAITSDCWVNIQTSLADKLQGSSPSTLTTTSTSMLGEDI